MNYTERLSTFKPLYSHERDWIPVLAAAKNEVRSKIFWHHPHDAEWSHDDVAIVLHHSETIVQHMAHVRDIRERRAILKNKPPQHAFHYQISNRAPGRMLERQKQIDHRLLAVAHRMPGVSMTDNLRRNPSPSAQRLALTT